MHIVRPRFRPWRILFALVFAYLASGFVYIFAKIAGYIFEHGSVLGQAIVEPFIVGVTFSSALYFGALTGLGALFSGGFPIVDMDTNERASLYPIILPLALVFLAFATGGIRFGRKPRRD